MPAPTQPEEMRSAALARATIRGLVLRQLLANLAGLVTVMLFLWLVFPTQDSGAQRDTELNLIVFAAYVGGTVIIGLPLNWLLLQGLIRWIQGKRPGVILRALTLRIPTFEATFAMLGWIGAAIIFASVNRSPRIGVGIAIAGLLTCAAIFLILERHLRPVFELTLDGRVHGRRSNNLLPRLMLFWALGSGLPVLIIGLIPLVAPTSTTTSWRSSLLIAVALAGGGAIMRIAALSITRPVEAVRKAMASVTDGNLAVHVPVDDLGETGRLAEGFNTMVDGLAERERVREQFGRQVGRAVAEWALANPEVTVEGQRPGSEMVVSVLFVDINGFTAFSERHSPSEVVSMLNEFFQMVDNAAEAHGGWINKFEGDAALIVFGAPTEQPDHAAQALATAVDIRNRCEATTRWPGVGIGVATGLALAGLVGSRDRYEYTVIGDVVNIASRVSDLAKDQGVPVLATVDSIAAAAEHGLPNAVRWRSTGFASIRGRAGEVELFVPADRP